MRRNYVWNMIASVINASEAVVILMIASRIVDMKIVGILTLSFSVSNLMMCIGKFGMRNFQVSDVINKYEFDTYFKSRVVSILIMSLSFGIYVIYGMTVNSYGAYKCLILFGVYLMYAAEVLEDVFWGDYQKNGRLDIGARMFSLRWGITLVTLGIGMYITNEVLIPLWISVLVDWLVLTLLLLTSKKTAVNPQNAETADVTQLMKQCAPMAISNTLSYYIINVSKYAIDSVLSDEVQAAYGFVFMPVFVIGVVNMIIYQPILLLMSNEWNSGNLTSFCRRIKLQVEVICIFSGICISVASKAGIRVMSALFGVDLLSYRYELLMLMFSGLWLALTGFFVATLTIMRYIKVQLVVYSVISLAACILTKPIVIMYKTKGAATISMVWTFALMFVFAIIMYRHIRERYKET